MNFEFTTPTRIIFGTVALRKAGALARDFGTRALVVTGRDASRAEPLLQILRENGVSGVPFSVPGEPQLSTVENGTALARTEGCQMTIGFGGGSALDTAKAIAAMLTNEGGLLNHVEVVGLGKPLTRPSDPFIAIPTTAGTGAEVTRNAVLASPEHRVKISLRSPLMLARVAIIDPELTYTLPSSLTASTGLDALTQLIEPYVCIHANPITDDLCIEGIRRAAESLRAVFKDGQNKAAREDMSLASLFSGFALSNAGLGAVHGLAGPIGGMFPAPHGAVCAALLPHVMEANIRALRKRASKSEALRRYDEIGCLLTGKVRPTADDGVEWVRKLVADLEIPNLRAYGVTKGHAAEIAEKAHASSSMKSNPIQLATEEMAETLQQAI
jgi:alcohol dehydrogenase class IV